MPPVEQNPTPCPRSVTSTCIMFFLLFAGIVDPALADNVDDVLKNIPVPEHIVGADAVSHLQAFDRTGGVMRTSAVPVEGMPFVQAREIEITGTAKYVHWVQLGTKNTRPVHRGDVLFLSFRMQALESKNDTGEGIVSVAFQKEWADRAFQITFTSACDGAWKRQYLRAVAKRDYQPGEGTLRFMLGFRPQKIRIAEVQFLNFGNDVEIDELPAMPVGYRGMEPDTIWRKKALARIEQHRKSDITVLVTDSRGNAVCGANVSLKQTHLAFGLGAAHSSKLYHSESFQDELPVFQNQFKRLFNKAVLPNILKWKQYPQRGKAAVMPAYGRLCENQIPVRGHCIIWPGWNYLPRQLRPFAKDPDTLRRLCEDRIDSLLADWSGKLAEWDVVNEAYMQDDLLEICGREILVDWFKHVRRLDPQAKLYYNDANVFANHQPGHADHYYETIRWLLKQGAPVDGMGFQSHVHTLVPPEVVYRRIERFAQLGPDIQITEFDVHVPDISDELQARYAGDYLIVVFSHPGTVGVVTWLGGMPLREIETAHPSARTQCAFFRKDWTIKPIGQVWLDLKQKEWNTNAKGQTDAKGGFQTRGFHGDYNITVSHNGETKKATATVGKEAAMINLQL